MIDIGQNTRHRYNPKVGDYWHEMFCPVMVVVAVHPDRVVICKTKKPVDDYHWTWDLAKLEPVTHEEFAAIPLYKSPGMGEKTYCDVEPEHHVWVREAAIKLFFGERE